MKSIVFATSLTLLAGSVLAQTASLAPSSIAATSAAIQATSRNPAIKDSDPVRTATAAKGANSFTEDQARRRIAKAGYTGVGTLTKDENGVWRGMASTRGTAIKVGLDYKGNVITD